MFRLRSYWTLLLPGGGYPAGSVIVISARNPASKVGLTVSERLRTLPDGHWLAVGQLAARTLGERTLGNDYRRDSLHWPTADAEQPRRELANALRMRHRALGDRYDLALVSVDAPPDLRECVEAILAQLRDVAAKRVWVALPKSGPRALGASDLTALGFTPLPTADAAQTGSLYGYDVATYKRTPDWLNPSGWAHPQLWDKFRW